MPDRQPESLLRRATLGLWFCAIAALGLVQFRSRAFHEARFEPTTIAWMWLGGSIVLAVLGAVLVIRAVRR